MDKYRDYSAVDFLDDERFLKWLCDPTQEDIDFWNTFLKNHPYKKAEIKEAILISKLFHSSENKLKLTEQYELWEKIQNESKSSSRTYFLGFLKYVAVFVLVFFSGAVSYRIYQNLTIQQQFQLAESIPAAKGEAMIVLADGSTVSLEKQMSQISYSENGEQLIVNKDTIQLKPGSQAESINKVIISYGKKSMILLADGTKIWLNAGSQLAFPAVFSDEIRQVTLVGEAFFDVAKNPEKPFIVKTSDLSVQVLGTRFDISAYPEDKVIQTVLEEGRVYLKYLGKGILNREYAIEMQPNQIVELDKASGTASRKMVDVSKYISWKDGLLEFEKVDLERALKQVERFYDIKILLSDDAIRSYKLSGKLDLKDEPEKVLNVIKLTVPINWQRKSNGDFIITKK
ncbi:anti-sigma factor [Aquipluma nitroreducens]|uniref:Anti-sigma factor n=1 Tax=Aquipluma nitroreducens TaxID=2010828 RepID=A0A5K7SBS9_9BACT|nr:FecR domain-containing protein [Aquipluma nitroreducens]BBE18917.1 anti-sigma factor [Aquipluma nitroreducens]